MFAGSKAIVRYRGPTYVTPCLQALKRLSDIEVQLNTMDLPRNSEELADRHSQLSNVIVEVSMAAQTEGRLLLERVSRDDSGADGVRHRVRTSILPTK